MTLPGNRRRVPLVDHPATGWWVALLIFSGFIYFQSSGPMPEGADWDIPNFDKVLHVVAYGIWASVAFLGLRASAWPESAASRAVIAALAATLYGASDEIHQAFVPSRSSDWTDLAADAVGAIAATFLWAILDRRALPPARRARNSE